MLKNSIKNQYKVKEKKHNTLVSFTDRTHTRQHTTWEQYDTQF